MWKTILQYNILVLAYMCKLRTVQSSTLKIVVGPGQEAEPSLEAHNWFGTKLLVRLWLIIPYNRFRG